MEGSEKQGIDLWLAVILGLATVGVFMFFGALGIDLVITGTIAKMGGIAHQIAVLGAILYFVPMTIIVVGSWIKDRVS